MELQPTSSLAGALHDKLPLAASTMLTCFSTKNVSSCYLHCRGFGSPGPTGAPQEMKGSEKQAGMMEGQEAEGESS